MLHILLVEFKWIDTEPRKQLLFGIRDIPLIFYVIVGTYTQIYHECPRETFPCKLIIILPNYIFEEGFLFSEFGQKISVSQVIAPVSPLPRKQAPAIKYLQCKSTVTIKFL